MLNKGNVLCSNIHGLERYEETIAIVQ